MKFFSSKSVKGKSKLFISIGAGYNQLPLIREAKALGYHVIGVDKNTNAAGIIESDIRIQESVSNYEEIFITLQELLLEGKVKSVLSRSYGNAVKTAAYLAEKLEIPFIPFKNIEGLINKKKMRAVLKKNKINVPDSFENLKKKSSLSFPAIIKPSQGHAKAGVRFIRDQEELKKYISSIKNYKEENYIIEKYVVGDEIIALGICRSGKFHLAEISDKETTETPSFIDVRHIVPSKYMSKWDEIEETGQRICEAFGIVNSPLVIEIKIDGEGDLCVIESVAEFGGEFLADVLLPQVTGYNFIRQTILATTGEDFTPPNPKLRKWAGVVHYIMGRKGELASYDPQGPGTVPGIVFSRILKELGSKVDVPETNHDRIGVVVARGKTRENALEIAAKAIEEFKIKITPNRGG